MNSSARKRYKEYKKRKFYQAHLSKEDMQRVLKFKTRRRRHREFLLITQKVCQFCGSDKDLTVDHIIPVSKTGQHRDKNLANKQLLCLTCNRKKGTKIMGKDDYIAATQKSV